MDRLPGARASEHRHNRQARHHTSRRGGGGGGGGKRVAVFVAMFRALSVNLPPRVRACWLSSNWRPTCRHESRRTRHAGSARLNYTQDCPVGMVRGEKVRQAREGMQKGRGKAREGWTPRGRGGEREGWECRESTGAENAKTQMLKNKKRRHGCRKNERRKHTNRHDDTHTRKDRHRQAPRYNIDTGRHLDIT